MDWCKKKGLAPSEEKNWRQAVVAYESKDEEPIPQTWENLRPDWRDIWYVCGSEVSRIQGFNSCKHNIRIAGEWIKFTSFIKVFAPEDGDPLFVRKEEG